MKEARAGDIVAIAGLKDVVTGDTLCDEKAPVLLERMEFPDPVIKVGMRVWACVRVWARVREWPALAIVCVSVCVCAHVCVCECGWGRARGPALKGRPRWGRAPGWHLRSMRATPRLRKAPPCKPQPALSPLCLQVAIEPKTKGDLDKMTTGLIKLAQEDPSFHFRWGAQLVMLRTL